MTINGSIKCDGDYFIIEFPSIGVITQTLDEDDIIPMAIDAIETLRDYDYEFKFKIIQKGNKLYLKSNHQDFVRFAVDRMKHERNISR